MVTVGVTRISTFVSFDLARSCDCGQAFRWKNTGNGWFGVAGGRGATVRQTGETLIITPGKDKDVGFWLNYFDLYRNYQAIEDEVRCDATLGKCLDYASGIHIFNQDPFETLISFIISANNNIKRIKGIISRLCDNFGEDKGDYRAFPTAERIAACSLEDLAVLRSGFRAKYILDAAQKISSGEIDLERLKTVPTDEARDELMKIKGVGPKVADCALLFSLCHIDAFPKDVWIKRAMQALFGGELPDEELIRPLYKVKEKDIIAFSNYNGLKFLQCACKFTENSAHNEGLSKRKEIKALIEDIKKVNPNVDDNIFRSIHNVNMATIPGWRDRDSGTLHSFTENY